MGVEEFLVEWQYLARKHKSVLVNWKPDGSESLILERLQVWPIRQRRKGKATRALTDICALADAHHVSITGFACPLSQFSPSVPELLHWLHRHGFDGDDENVYRAPITR